MYWLDLVLLDLVLSLIFQTFLKSGATASARLFEWKSLTAIVTFNLSLNCSLSTPNSSVSQCMSRCFVVDMHCWYSCRTRVESSKAYSYAWMNENAGTHVCDHVILVTMSMHDHMTHHRQITQITYQFQRASLCGRRKHWFISICFIKAKWKVSLQAGSNLIIQVLIFWTNFGDLNKLLSLIDFVDSSASGSRDSRRACGGCATGLVDRLVESALYSLAS